MIERDIEGLEDGAYLLPKIPIGITKGNVLHFFREVEAELPLPQCLCGKTLQGLNEIRAMRGNQNTNSSLRHQIDQRLRTLHNPLWMQVHPGSSRISNVLLSNSPYESSTCNGANALIPSAQSA